VFLYLLEEVVGWLSSGEYVGSLSLSFSPVPVPGEIFGAVVRPLFCDIAWASLLWRCQSLVDPRVSLYGAGGVAYFRAYLASYAGCWKRDCSPNCEVSIIRMFN
jgi:hypothetical protein